MNLRSRKGGNARCGGYSWRTNVSKLPETGFLRLSQIIGNPKSQPPIPAVIPVSKSTWWEGVKTGRYPQPVRTLGARITAWRVEDIRALVASA
jgi:predicted DNA-binding transcriptional regulator AlpA